MSNDLLKIADDVEKLLPLFNIMGFEGLTLPSKQAARFKGLCFEAKAIIGDELGGGSHFSLQIGVLASRLSNGPSITDVEEAAEQMRAASRMIERRKARPAAAPAGTASFVDPTRIAALQDLQGGTHDFKRLIELCREINITSGQNCHMATAMLLRAIVDHVPPVFGFTSFVQVANNYAGPKSLKGSLSHLQNSFRDKADMLLHGPIRAREDLPTAVQVNYSNDLDVVLGEVIRLSS